MSMDFEFTPEPGWDYEEDRWRIPEENLPLSPDDVSSIVLRMVFGLCEDDLGTAVIGAKATGAESWIYRYGDSGGNQFGTVDIEREPGKTWLRVRMDIP